MKRVLLIINPASGKLKGKNMLFDIVNEMSKNDCLVSVMITRKCGDATEFATFGCESGMFDQVVCSGGDGTLNETVSGIMRSKKKLPLGYIPAGSTNDYAKSVGIPIDIKESSLQSVIKEARPIDIGSFNGRHFNYIASFGVFSAVSYSTPKSMKNMMGHFAYVLAGAKDIAKIKSYHAVIECDGKQYEGNYIFGCLANTTSVGGVVHVKEEMVEFNDGLFEVCFVKKPKNPIELLKIVSGALHSDFSDEMFDAFKASTLKITMDEKTDWSLDGEKYESAPDIEFQVIKSAVEIVF